MKNNLPFPLPDPPKAIRCDTAGDAIAVIHLAHWLNIPASYHPMGGQTAKKNIPVTHYVYVMADNLKTILSYLENGK